jgi:erythronate-4-phosphate dehydrogenase
MITIDENIPHAREAFESLGAVQLLPGRSITRRDLADSEALIVRSITRVDRELLEGTPVRFVGTATNGLDHIDLDYLRDAGIVLADIGGANAEAVSEYVIAALLELRRRGLRTLRGERLGVVGMGKIGGRVVDDALALGLDVVAYDPPREESDPAFTSASLDELLDCDIVTIHVPYTEEGSHPTRNLVDDSFLGGLRRGATLLNTSRGGVADSEAMIAAVDAGRLGSLVLDVWRGEPAIPVELIERCAIATPHIASYSIDAKAKGTEVMVHALAGFMGRLSDWSTTKVLPAEEGSLAIPPGTDRLDALAMAVSAALDIARDDAALRALLPLGDEERRRGFDGLRKNYPRRREFHALRVTTDDAPTAALLAAYGFAGEYAVRQGDAGR